VAGNIRELQNAVERALIVSDGGLLTTANFGIDPEWHAFRRSHSRRRVPRPAAAENPDSLHDIEKRMSSRPSERPAVISPKPPHFSVSPLTALYPPEAPRSRILNRL